MNFDRHVARLIDHTILRPDAIRSDVARVCAEAREYGFASVCVNSCWCAFVTRELMGSDVKTCAVAGFPLGATNTAVKVAEALDAIDGGAREVDMVMNIGAIVGGEPHIAEADIRGMAIAAERRGATLKVILETALLNDEQKVLACRIAVDCGAGFVKTSTGFGKGGATVEDVALMRRTVGPEVGVKASGGIRTLADVKAMVAAGASRIGASAGVQIVQETVSPETRGESAHGDTY